MRTTSRSSRCRQSFPPFCSQLRLLHSENLDDFYSYGPRSTCSRYLKHLVPVVYTTTHKKAKSDNGIMGVRRHSGSGALAEVQLFTICRALNGLTVHHHSKSPAHLAFLLGDFVVFSALDNALKIRSVLWFSRLHFAQPHFLFPLR
ncbi:hypothetical protein L484_000958 [Morus notabilis]|uniref:Uncharacterized protein n=1 Tax=Morus notabilis TaxID=981085 RepID=W9RDP9_9ROSA|nr:hypothetical protein L484_000958 [Morus notabilis]